MVLLKIFSLGSKIDKWTQSVKKLSDAAKLEPHAAFVTLSKSIQNEWLYVQRVVADSEYAFIPLKEIIKNLFLPNLSGLEFDNKETDILCRPTCYLGLGIHDPVKTASNQFTKLLSDMVQTKN